MLLGHGQLILLKASSRGVDPKSDPRASVFCAAQPNRSKLLRNLCGIDSRERVRAREVEKKGYPWRAKCVPWVGQHG